MKVLITLTGMFLMGVCQAQKNKDNTITINHFIPYNQLKATLFDYNFGISNSDTSLITTTDKASGIANVNYLIKRTDTSVILKCFYNGEFGGMKFGNELVNYSWGAPKVRFLEMKKFAISFGYPLTFSKQ